MLILSRKKGQSIVINEEIEIFVIGIEGDQVKLGIEAPAKVKIYRKEVLDSIRESNKAAMANPSQLKAIKGFALEAVKKNEETT
ncbi:carbon storage regulator CsrA [Cohnella candidum]|uniref:Translational regulator CsrA n=1 Tax=Cohnella candidum TaxID=2674991 RepID=A0A3G3K2Y8_9BACL|nr:carbon storage regulator CsrA [Cohnella candidum]AYQ74139.1 carbon storage regulator [Cohnella candidum]